MRLLRQCLRGALVWMTAASVLLAGFPHYQCRCPDGSLKLFCLGWALGKDCCCSGGGCPAPAPQGSDRTACAAPAEPAKKSCCCHHRHAPNDQGPDTHTRVTSSGCQKTVTPAEFVAAPAAPKVVPHSVAAAAFLLPPQHPLPLPSSGVGGRPCIGDGDRAPPTDLIITLQHLVI